MCNECQHTEVCEHKKKILDAISAIIVHSYGIGQQCHLQTTYSFVQNICKYFTRENEFQAHEEHRPSVDEKPA